MSLKQLKIDAKQALETWELRWKEITQWDLNDIPQQKQDELVDLAMLSGGELKDALEDIIQFMDDIDNEAHSKNPELIAFREDLATALKETLNYRHSIDSYTQEALFAEVGELDALVDVDLLFVDDEVLRTNAIEDIAEETEPSYEE